MPVRWLSLTEACQSLRVSESTLRRRIKQGRIESKLENGQRLVLIEVASQTTVTEDSLVQEFRSEVEHLKQELDRRNQQIEQQNMIVMQLTRQLEQSQRLLEYHQAPWWRRIFRRKE